MKKFSVSSSLMMAGLVMLVTSGNALAQSQTAQSAMVEVTTDNPSYLIEGTITWAYNRDGAETYYTNAWDGKPPVLTAGTGPIQTSPGAPLPDSNKLMQHAQAERCTFFWGGQLTAADSYTQTVNGTRGWKWVYTYTITPNPSTNPVAAHTAWTSEETGSGTVNIVFGGFVASESYLKQNGGKTKYSFTLTEPNPLGGEPLSRVQNVSAQLEKFNGVNWTVEGDPILFGTLPVTATVEDYVYFGNGGVFGNAAVANQLHADVDGNGGGGKLAANVSAILLQDNFANNNTDLTNGNVHEANYEGTFAGISEAGDYRIVLSGTIKGNSATAAKSFDVESEMFVIGGCKP